MRTIGDIKMTPNQILKIAESQNNLYAIEKLTFFNIMKMLSDNQQVFENKKLFINCMPNISSPMRTSMSFTSLTANSLKRPLSR